MVEAELHAPVLTSIPGKETTLRKTVLACAALAAAAFAPSAAQASEGGQGCPGEPPSSQVFWDYDADPDFYFLAPGGDFAANSGWDLDDGAMIVNGTLAMPTGSEAVSPPICVRQGYPHGRMYGAASGLFAGLPGDLGKAKLRVEVIYDGEESEESNSLKLSAGSLKPTDRFVLDERAFGLDPVTGNATVRLVFKSRALATALIDNVYIDPRARI
jgi:hypothetical protein